MGGSQTVTRAREVVDRQTGRRPASARHSVRWASDSAVTAEECSLCSAEGGGGPGFRAAPRRSAPRKRARDPRVIARSQTRNDPKRTRKI